MLKMAPEDRPLISKGPVVIKNNVWVGEGVAILAGVTIGENSIISTNALVTKSVPQCSGRCASKNYKVYQIMTKEPLVSVIILIITIKNI